MLDEIKIPSPINLRKRPLLLILIFSLVLMGVIGYWLIGQRASLGIEVYLAIAIFPVLLFLAVLLMFRQIKHIDTFYGACAVLIENYELTLDNLSEGLIATDKNGRVQYMNTSAERLTGWTLLEAKKNALA